MFSRGSEEKKIPRLPNGFHLSPYLMFSGILFGMQQNRRKASKLVNQRQWHQLCQTLVSNFHSTTFVNPPCNFPKWQQVPSMMICSIQCVIQTNNFRCSPFPTKEKIVDMQVLLAQIFNEENWGAREMSRAKQRSLKFVLRSLKTLSTGILHLWSSMV